MFDFEKLDVYRQLREQNVRVLQYLETAQNLDPYISEQLRRASWNAVLNLAEGTGRMTKADKKHYLTIARSSVFEVVAIFQGILDMGKIDRERFDALYNGFEEVSKMLLGMIRSYTEIPANAT
jgi:four helix bundle protein